MVLDHLDHLGRLGGVCCWLDTKIGWTVRMKIRCTMPPWRHCGCYKHDFWIVEARTKSLKKLWTQNIFLSLRKKNRNIFFEKKNVIF